MKLYNENDPAPNPRRVRLFMKEKGLAIPLVRTSLAHYPLALPSQPLHIDSLPSGKRDEHEQ